jgi:hypothetical protein
MIIVCHHFQAGPTPARSRQPLSRCVCRIFWPGEWLAAWLIISMSFQRSSGQRSSGWVVHLLPNFPVQLRRIAVSAYHCLRATMHRDDNGTCAPLPGLQLARELACRLAAEKGTLDVDKRGPRPDRQETGLVKGIK